MKSKLVHRDLINLGKMLGHMQFDGGVCQGYSMMLAQAQLANDEATFYKRINLISEYKAKDPGFSALIRDINQAKERVKKRLPLTRHEHTLLSIPAFFDGISLYLNPHRHNALFHHNHTKQTDHDLIYTFAQSELLNKTNLATPLHHNYVFNKTRLKQFLMELAKTAAQSSGITPIVFEGMGHTVCLSLSKNSTAANPAWDYVDTNDFQRFNSHPAYSRKLSTDDLVRSLFTSLSQKGNYLITHVGLLSSTNDAKFNEACSEFAKKFPMLADDINKNDDGNHLLHLACKYADLPLIQKMLEQGANINQLNKRGVTPLHIACMQNHPEVLQLLLDKGALVNQKSHDGFTPLHIACYSNNQKLATLLLANGAAVNQKDTNGFTPLFIAKSHKYSNVVIELEKVIAKLEKDKAIQKVKNSIDYLRQYALERSALPRGQLAGEIAKQLADKFKVYTQSKKIYNPTDCQQFINECNKILASSRQNIEFQTHRARYKIVLANLAIALTGLGALFILGKMAHSWMNSGKISGFFHKTRGFQNIERIEYNIKNLSPS